MTAWIVGYLVAVALTLLFNWGAHRKPTPRPPVKADPVVGTGTTGILATEDTADTGSWT